MDLMRAMLNRDAFRELETMSNRLNNLVGDRRPVTRQEDETMAVADWTPVVDVLETNENFQIEVELPGVEKSAVKLSVENGILMITGDRPQRALAEGMRYHRNERPSGRFERVFRVPESVDEQKLAAELKDGILTVRLPKVEKARPKSIQVSVT